MMSNKNNANHDTIKVYSNTQKLSKHQAKDIYNQLIVGQKNSKRRSSSHKIDPLPKNSHSTINPQLQPQVSTIKPINPQAKSMYKTNSIFLPHLQTKRIMNKLFEEKYVVNESIFIHERKPIGNSSSLQKQLTYVLEDKSKKLKKILEYQTNFLTQETKNKQKAKINRPFGDIEIVEVSSNKTETRDQIQTLNNETNSFSEKNQLTKELKRVLNRIIDPRRSQFNNHFPEIDQPIEDNCNSHIIQKLISNYHRNKRVVDQKVANSQKNLMIRNFDDLDNIKIKGQQTNYFSKQNKKKPNKLRDDSPSKNISKFQTNWKIKPFPFDHIQKSEANKIFTRYLYLKEVTPIQTGYYKVFLGEGNNSWLIGKLLKGRGYWTTTETIEDAHLIWTQLPSEEHMKKLQKTTNLQIHLQSPIEHHQVTLVKQDEEVSKFLEIKGNDYFEGLKRLFLERISNHMIKDIAKRFKNNLSIKNYSNISEHYLKIANRQDLDLKIDSKDIILLNHCDHSNQIGNKKTLFYHLQRYSRIADISQNEMIPETIHLGQKQIESLKHCSSDQFNSTLGNMLNRKILGESAYILKPGECTNRGNGITVHLNQDELIGHLSKSLKCFPQNKTYIIQRYIDPLLYNNRKFDIRMWALFTNNKVWLYKEGYVRTSCKEFNLKNTDKFIHLTNDAVQKYSTDYGKYQPGNKLSFHQMDRYLKKSCAYDGFYTEIYQSIKDLSKRLFEIGGLVLGQSNFQFELFGLDFLVDSSHKVWLIECNTNPCLETSCSLLNRLIPNMLDNLLTITVDPYFPPNERRIQKDDIFQSDKFNFEMLLDLQEKPNILSQIAQNDDDYLKVLKNINPIKLI